MSKKKSIRRPKKEMSDKEIRRLKKEVTQDVTMRVLVLSVAAMADELKLKDEKIGKVAARINTYSGHLQEHRIRMQEVRKIIKDQTGIQFGGKQ